MTCDMLFLRLLYRGVVCSRLQCYRRDCAKDVWVLGYVIILLKCEIYLCVNDGLCVCLQFYGGSCMYGG